MSFTIKTTFATDPFIGYSLELYETLEHVQDPILRAVKNVPDKSPTQEKIDASISEFTSEYRAALDKRASIEEERLRAAPNLADIASQLPQEYLQGLEVEI